MRIGYSEVPAGFAVGLFAGFEIGFEVWGVRNFLNGGAPVGLKLVLFGDR